MPVELRPENVKIYQVYSLVRGQVITAGMNGTVIDVLIPSIEIVMKWLKIPPRMRGHIGLRVLNIARIEIKELREKQQQETSS